MELMGATTEAMTPLRQKGELIQDLGWEDGKNGRVGGPAAPEWRRQSTGTRPKGSVEQQEQIPQAPPRKPERRSQNWSRRVEDGDLETRPRGLEREPAGESGALRFTMPYERRDEWREPRWGRVDKWDIHFDGDPDPVKLTVEYFVFRVEFPVQRQGRRSWDEVLDNFHWQFVRERPPEVWEDLKVELVSRFRATEVP
ncbi:uncharacterized protein DMAD_02440 [Drosophila madeirensis]|uniref:Uncharacterized protein n=1 Tax=Drosophila madeirensis TaxID=30013 RepID=A0AAU9G5B2_DROMD